MGAGGGLYEGGNEGIFHALTRRWGQKTLLMVALALYSLGGLWILSSFTGREVTTILGQTSPFQSPQLIVERQAAGKSVAERSSKPLAAVVPSPLDEEDDSTDWDVDGPRRPPGAASIPQGKHPHNPEKDRPEAFQRCGDWQEEYMELHRQILAGERPPRYLVAVLSQSGLADQLVGVMSLFFWALLTGRAFQITVGEQPIPPLEAAFDAPYVNWTRPAGDPLVLTQHLYRPFKGKRRYPKVHSLVPNIEEFGSMYLINNKSDFFATKDLNTLPLDGGADKPVLFMASNRGRVFRLFDNPHHGRKLFDMGLRPETAFACGFRFLFAPNAMTRDETGWQLAEEYLLPGNFPDDDDEQEKSLAFAEDVLRIGIQIRVGDFVFNAPGKAQALQLKDYMAYFDCAREIENHKRTVKTSKVLWYLVSDSQRLKELALDEFGPDLLVTSTEPSRHVLCVKDGLTDCNERDDMADSLAAAAADMMGLAETDYIILTHKSGFGKVAAWLNMRWHNVWWLAPGEPKPSVCGPRAYVQLEQMADKWSGL